MQAIEELPFVFVDSLDMHIKHRRSVDLHFVLCLQIGGELQLVLLAKRNKRLMSGAGIVKSTNMAWSKLGSIYRQRQVRREASEKVHFSFVFDSIRLYPRTPHRIA